ncbi:MAG: DUF4349 domain-containing protein [Chloroflexi bacterium]|nr:DUF4349 domain-containing protein [Chloroflexota bacterium]
MKRLLVFAILTLAIAGCATVAPTPPDIGIAPLPPERGLVEPEVPVAVPGEDFAGQPELQERMIVRTAEITMVVENTEESLNRIEALAIQLGGYVSNSQSWKQEEQLFAFITIRVPADRFDNARQDIKDLAVEPPTETQNTQDVTQEFVDLEARLENLQRTEEELQILLTEVRQRSGKVQDILEIFRELTAIRQQIEQLQGQIQYLDNLVALASITVSLSPQEQVVDTGWDPGKTVREALHDLVEALQVLADIAIRLLLTFLPLFLLLFIPFLVVFWFVRRWWLGRIKPTPSI